MSALWGASFPLLRIASPAFGPMALAGIRCALAAVVLTLLMRLLGEHWPARASWMPLAGLGLLTVVAPFVFFNWAALTLPAGYSAVLNATAPVFGVISAAVAGDEKITPRSLLGCVAGFAGVALLVQLGPVEVTPRVILAALACTAAAGCFGIGTTFMKRASANHPPLAAAATIHIAAALMLAVPVGVAVPTMQLSIEVWLAVALLGLVTSGFMYWISLRLMREIPASAATSAAFMIPLFGVTWGGLFLNEPVTAGMIPGSLLILLATALITGFNPWRLAARQR
jgi:drug/metabolite transporter (DMT)-like permease